MGVHSRATNARWHYLYVLHIVKWLTVTINVCWWQHWHYCRYSSADWNKFISQDRDLCQPLDGFAVCQSLNSSDRICAPTGWAGDVIRRALNRTQAALSSLFESIELKLRQTSARETRRHRYEARAGPTNNQSRQSRRRQRRDDQLAGIVDAVELCTDLARVVLPAVAALLVSRAAYSNYHAYVVHEDLRQTMSDGLWTDVDTRTTKKSRRTAAKNAMELRHAVECSSVGDAVFIVVLHLGFSATCCVFDLALYWLLVVVGRHTAPPPFDFTGADSVEAVTSGDGTIVAVLAEFLTILHAGHWFGFTDSGYLCSVHPATPDYMTLVIIVLLYIVLLVFTVIQSTVVSWQNRTAAYFYPDQEQRKRLFYAALVAARRDRRLHGVDDDEPGAAQKDLLTELVCLGPTSWRPGTPLAVRRAAAPVSAGPRCVACGQPVSRRLRKARASPTRLSTDDCLDAEVCPVWWGVSAVCWHVPSVLRCARYATVDSHQTTMSSSATQLAARLLMSHHGSLRFSHFIHCHYVCMLICRLQQKIQARHVNCIYVINQALKCAAFKVLFYFIIFIFNPAFGLQLSLINW